jgi:hypothetical protein
MTQLIEEASRSFDQLCQQRHEHGQKEYGVFTFLENDVIRMLAEELADTANYCRMQFIKLLLLQKMLEEELSEKLDTPSRLSKQGQDIISSIGSFRGTGEHGWTSHS